MTEHLIFYDSESTINGGAMFGSHPLYHSNKGVMAGTAIWNTDGKGSTDKVYITDDQADTIAMWEALLDSIESKSDRTYTIVGHNIGFDMKLLGAVGIKVLQHPRVRIWDTMVAEYIINGQDHTLTLTLEATALRHGIEFKKSEAVQEMFKRGLGADHILPAVLRPYLEDDVKVLPPLMLSQMSKMREQGQENIVRARMEAQKQLTIAEYHGMAFDSKVIEDAMPALQADADILKAELQVRVGGVELDLTSPSQLTKWLYGGTVEVSERKPVGLYKNGKVKYGTIDRDIIIPPAYEAKTDGGTTEQELRALDTALKPDVEQTIERVIQYRNVSKELSTYCRALLNLNMNGWICGNINTTVTVTGRLSSSKPNLQNIKNGRLKAAFKSRYGEDGCLIEVDYAQLEIIALAALTQDKQLIEDIEAGVDIHTALFHDMYHRVPTKDERKAFKPRTFALVYGASAHGIAQNAKCTKSEAERFIKTFYDRYPGVAAWHKLLKNEWVGQSKPVPGQYPKATFKHRSPTGLLLTYYTGERNTFSPTQLVNYPVQSFAADIVQLMIPKVAKVLGNFSGALLVNVVHDSFLIDCWKDDANGIIMQLKEVLSRTPFYVYDELGVDMGIDKMDVGISMGPNWADMKEIV